MDKDKIKSTFDKIGKKAVKITKKIINEVGNELSYYTSIETFKIIKSPQQDEIKKTLCGFIDQDLKIIYIKEDDLLIDKKNLVKGSVVKLKDKSLYEIKDVDYTKTYDYLLKKYKKYHAISCYKIYLKSMFE